MAKRFFLVAGLLALLAAAALFFLERPTLEPEATADPATGAERVSPLSAKPGEKAPSVPAREAIAAPLDPDSLLDPETIPPETLPLPMNDPVQLLVVERATGRPVPGAEVAWLVARFRRIDPFYCGPLGWEEVLFKSGRKLRTDSRGEALLPRTPWPISIAARSAGLLGVTNAGMQCCQETVHLPLDPVPEITIQVVDAGGKPQAGVPLILWSGSDRAPDSREVLWQGLSAGPEGTAKARSSWARLDAAPQQALVGFHPVLGSTPLVPLDLRFPPTETVRLTSPPAGSVVVRILDEQGRAIQEGILVDLSIGSGALRPTPQEGVWVLPVPRAIQAHLSQGAARFPHVALGSELSVMARSPRGARYPGVGQDLPGPTRAGEELELTLRFRYPASRLTGIVLDDAGARLENTLLQLVFTATHGQVRQTGSSEFALTDDEGRFLAWSPGGSAATQWELEITSWQATERSGRAAGPGALVSFPGERLKGLLDLGEIRLGPGLPVLTGVVRDELGWPVPGARIATAELPAGQRAWAASFSDEQGRFRLAWRGPGALSVTASQRGFLEQSQSVASYEEPLLFTLRRAGILAGTLLMDEGIPANRISMRVERDGLRKAGGLPGPDGGFSFGPLEPGEYTLRAVLHDRELARVESISVEPDRKEHDPRLAPLDLRGLLAWFSLQLLDKQGRPPSQVWVAEPAPTGPVRLFGGRPDPQGWIRLLAPARSERFIVGSPLHRPRTLSWTDSGQRIVLDQGPGKVRLLLSAPGPSASIQEVDSFSIHLEPLSGGIAPSRELLFRDPIRVSSHPVSGRPGLVAQALALPAPGPYRLIWTLHRKTEKGRSNIVVPQDPPCVIEVQDTPETQEFQVRLTLAEVETALRGL